jgi:hypothetical protein
MVEGPQIINHLRRRTLAKPSIFLEKVERCGKIGVQQVYSNVDTVVFVCPR